MIALKLGSATRKTPVKRPVAMKATTVKRRGEAPAHHFFASSVGAWKVGYDLATLIAHMKRDNLPFNIWMVPGGIEASYKIEMFTPQVEGAVWLSFYAKDADLI